MKILHLDHNQKWVPVEKRYYDNEAHLQDLLTGDVNTLPLEEIGYETKFVTIGKEVGLQNGSLDVLAISPQGNIALIETKLDKNPEVKRTVVGQILGYAAYLWNKSYEDVENNCFRKFLTQQKIKFSGSLVDYVKEKLGDDSLSEAEFKEGIEKRLRLGSFTLLIVVDRANQELIDIANYLNDRTGNEIDFYVIEMELVGDQQEQFLIPHLANPPRKSVTHSTEKAKSTDSYDRTPITQEEFLVGLTDRGRKLTTSLLDAFENSELVAFSWRKSGFSVMTKLPKKYVLQSGITSNFSYLYFSKQDSAEKIQFGYPEGAYKNIPELHPQISEYVNFYHHISSYDEDKKTIDDISAFDDKTITELVKLIGITAERLDSGINKELVTDQNGKE